MIAALIAGGLLLFGGGVGVGVAVSRDRTAAAVEADNLVLPPELTEVGAVLGIIE